MTNTGMIKKPRFSLSLRLTAIISFTLIVFLTVTGILLVNFLENSLISEKRNSFNEFADFVARSSAFHIENSSYYMLNQNSIRLQSNSGKNEIDILSVIMLGKDGQKLNSAGIPHSKIMVPPKYWESLERICYYTPRNKKRRAVGKVLIVFSLEQVYKKTAHIKTIVIISIVAIIVVLNILIFLFVSSGAVKRLNRLRSAVTTLVKDSAEAEKITDYANDEVGDIIRSFKHAAGTLNERSRRVDFRNKELEKSQGESKRKIRELQDQLKLRVRDLEKARTAADFAGKIKNQFLSNMSHEIRTPLSGILGMTNLLYDTDLTPKQQEYMKHLKKSGLLLSNIVNDILDISRIESGRWRLEEKPFDLEELVNDVLAPFQDTAAEKHLQFGWEIGKNVPHALIGDEKTASQVLANIVSNAIKFTEKGEVDIAVKLSSRQGDTAFVAFVVSDTGIGIPEERIDDIFDQFTQLDSSFTKQYSGTGLGLTIVKSLVEMLSGKILVESEPGEGTTFTVELPFKENFDIRQAIKIPKLDAAPGEQPGEKNKARILVAEDNEINLFFLESFLTKNGFTVHGVGHGKAVLEKMESHAYDLIIMDMKMPVMSGIQCTQLIREKEEGTDEKNTIIALTGLTMVEDRERIEQAGVDYIISKPVNEAALLKKIKEILG